jgi:23S rRNA pseudouridine2605 synthase
MAPTRPPRSPPRGRKPRGEGRSATTPRRDTGPAERIAKTIARAGLASRREAEAWIADGRVAVNGKVIDSPALDVTPRDLVEVDGRPLPERERTRLWLYHKPRGLVTTERDPEGRPTVFEKLPRDLPRVLSVGRLDINSEGLLLLTNDGGLKRALELPSTGWLRRYKVRAYGSIGVEDLVAIENGVTVDGIEYGPVEARIERRTGDNVWLLIGIREGKNREVRNILRHLGLEVNRLIRLSYGPFQLRELEEGEVEEVRLAILREQLGPRIVETAGIDLEGPVATAPPAGGARRRKAALSRPQGHDDINDRRATAKAERFARLQAGEAEDDEMTEDDTPDVEIDPSTGKISLKEKTLADRKGRRVAVAKKFDPAKAEERRGRARVLDESGELPRRPRPERREDDGARPQRRARPEGARSHSFRERGETTSGAERPRPRRREDGDGGGERREERPFKSAGYRDRGEGAGGARKSFGYKSREGGEPREERGERRPFRPREERSEGGGAGERRAWRPRIDREEGAGEERPQRATRPREERESGGERRPYRPRGEGGERGEGRSFRARPERRDEGGGERREARPFRPRGEGGERGEGRPYRPRGEGGERSEGRPYRPRAEGSERREGRPFRPRGESGERGEGRPYRPRSEGGERGEGRPYRPRGEGGERSEGRPYRPRGEGGERSEGRPYRPRGEGGERGEGRPYRPRGEGGERGEGRPYRPRGESAERGEGRPFRGRSEGGERRDGRPGGGPGRPRPGGGGGPRSGGPRGPRKPRGED